MASFSSSQATQPFSDVSQPGADLEQLISTLPSTSDLDFVRIFARCCLQKRLLFVSTYPGGAPAAVLDHDILGVSQSPRAIGCDVQIPSLNEEILRTHLRLYFHPAKDSITVRNMATTEAVALQSSSLSATSKQLMPGNSIDLAPGAWAIETWSPAEVPRPKIRLADLYLLPRQSATSPVNTTAAEGAGSKRRPEESAASSKKQKAATGSLAMPPSGTVSHPLLALSNGETVRVAGRDPKNNYQLTRERLVATTRSAVLYAARHSRRPGQLVLTKALKIGPSARHAAENWRREVSVHEGVGSHVSRCGLWQVCSDRTDKIIDSLALPASSALMLVTSPYIWNLSMLRLYPSIEIARINLLALMPHLRFSQILQALFNSSMLRVSSIMISSQGMPFIIIPAVLSLSTSVLEDQEPQQATAVHLGICRRST